MNLKTGFLNPRNRLVREVSRWLCDRVRSDVGAPSLSHVMVAVPTAQSGRNLRLALAKEAVKRGWGGIIPPKVVMPMQLVKAADKSQRVATGIELCAAFVSFVRDASAASSISDYPHLFLTRRTDGSPYDLAGDLRAQLAFFDQLQDIWRILAGGGMTMTDVPDHPGAVERFRAALGDEAERWRELAAFERAFFGRLHAAGLRHQAEDIRLARTSPEPIPDGIEEVVLPVLADPVLAFYDVLEHQRPDISVTVLLHCDECEANRFDRWGRPVLKEWTDCAREDFPGLRNGDIVRTASDGSLARSVAGDFPRADEEAARPSLGLCDDGLFPELSAAFLNRGYVLHNPERHRLAVSSLGRMLSNLIDLYVARKKSLPWTPFVSLLREDDVLAALADGEGGPGRIRVLAGIDACQNRFLPAVLPDGLAYDSLDVHPRQRNAFEAFVAVGRRLFGIIESAWSGGASPAEFLRSAMGAVFAGRSLSGTDAEREFRAATDAVREVLDGFADEGGVVARIGEGASVALLRKALSEASYSLEPSERNAVSTEGWLELIWSDADRIALAGFSEGAVPDSVVGHPFVPDDLRVALGLTSNAARMARDTMILADIVRSRQSAPGSVRAYLSATGASGDLRRPSRLLFLVGPAELPGRVERLFGDLPPGGMREARRVEPKWRLDLPLDAVPLPNVSEKCPQGRLSASAIDAWLGCPFTYLLKYGLGMERFREKTEFEANDFGQLIHGVLEDYANEQLERTRNGLAQLSDAGDISSALSRLLAVRRRKFGDRIALKLRLQFDAAEGRLLAFAPLQAKWTADGWRIAERPEYRFCVSPFAGEGDVDMPFNGSIDRIDFKEGVGYRLIDYKTWDGVKNVKCRVMKGGRGQCAHARRLGLPLLKTVQKNGKEKFSRFVSVQLLLYAACFERAEERFRGRVADCCYAILGKDAHNVAVLGSAEDQGEFSAGRGFSLMEHRELALDTARAAIRRIRGNVFWPPGPDDGWKFDFKELFMISPERDLPVGTPWRDAQEAKLAGLEAAE